LYRVFFIFFKILDFFLPYGILKRVIDLHKNQDIHLRCFKQNPVINFYKKLGFEVVEALPHHFRMVLLRKKEK